MGRTAFGWFMMGSGADFCEHGKEPSGSIKKVDYSLAS